jgi:hypothetical protein
MHVWVCWLLTQAPQPEQVQFDVQVPHACEVAGFPLVVPQLLESVHVLVCWLLMQAAQSVHSQSVEHGGLLPPQPIILLPLLSVLEGISVVMIISSMNESWSWGAPPFQ